MKVCQCVVGTTETEKESSFIFIRRAALPFEFIADYFGRRYCIISAGKLLLALSDKTSECSDQLVIRFLISAFCGFAWDEIMAGH